MIVYMIRHGMTKGNKEKRYVGSTDESILPEELIRFGHFKMEEVDKVVVSPLKRCRETAEILYRGKKILVEPDFRECDFGQFEYKNYLELKDHEAYQKFIDSNGTSGFPGGEDRDCFQKRCCEAFVELIRREKADSKIAMVVHGGTIMAILDEYSIPHKDYFCWQVKNGEGFVMKVDCKGDGIVCKNVKKVEKRKDDRQSE